MNWAMTHNIDAFIGAATASDSVTITAGVTGNGTQQTGLVVDRSAMTNPLSVSYAVRYKAVLGGGNTLALAATVITADDAAFTQNVNTLATFAKATVDTGGSGGSTQRGVFRLPVDFAGAQQFVRLLFTPTLSASSTDTAEMSIVAVLGGQDFLPA